MPYDKRLLYTSERDDWATPQPLFDQLHAEFDFTIDVCATPRSAKLPRYYTRDDDGLAQDWRGERVWMNPPYGKGIGAWMAKAKESARAGATVVCLVHARTDTRWFHDHVYGVASLRFIKGRLRFDESRQNAPFPSMLAIYTPPPVGD